MNNKSRKKEQFFVLFFPRSALGGTQRKHKDKSASLEASPCWRRSLLSATGGLGSIRVATFWSLLAFTLHFVKWTRSFK